TIAALEGALGFSRGVITYHFADKNEIVEAVLTSALAEIDARTTEEVGAAESLEDKVRAVLRTKVDGFLRSAEATRVLLAFWGRMASDDRARKLTAQMFAGYRKQGAQLAKWVLGPLAKKRADAMGTLFVSVVIGVVVMAMIDPGEVEVQAAIDEAARAFARRLSEA
ncbi:MAG: TetR family transcriptional regulator C-terminal domain-containing protein, partial [Deltaproteobacteria bacterium]|nr:TetR family transcriptional regulator C-terminal domain-containing protein [Deltaproteobacteria bacterium]